MRLNETEDEGGRWTKSRLSADNLCCVMVRAYLEWVLIADSKWGREPGNDRFSQPVIRVAADVYDAWLEALAVGDGRRVDGAPMVTSLVDGGVQLRSVTDDTVLVYTPEEWTAWLGGLDELTSDRLRDAA